MDFPFEITPGRGIVLKEHTGSPAEELCQLKEVEGAFFDGGTRFVRFDIGFQRLSQLREISAVFEVACRDILNRQTIENQPDGKVFDHRSGGDREGDSIAANFHLPQHARPTAQSEEGLDQKFRPFLTRDSEEIQRFGYGLKRREMAIGDASKFRAESTKPFLGGPARIAIEVQKGIEKSRFPTRESPVGETLIREGRTEANQDIIDESIAVDAGASEKIVPITMNSNGGGVSQTGPMNAIATDTPESLKGELFPSLFVPGGYRIGIESFNKIGKQTNGAEDFSFGLSGFDGDRTTVG